MSEFRWHLIFAAFGGLAYVVCMFFVPWQHPTLFGLWVFVLLIPAGFLGDILGLPPAGMHWPHFGAFVAVLLAQGFIVGLALFVAFRIFWRSPNRND